MKILSISFLLMASLLQAQAPPLPKRAGVVFSARDTIVVADPAYEKPVLVLDIRHNERLFAATRKTVTDTLKGNLVWRSFTDTDSIKRYSDSKFVKEILIIERK